MTDQKKLENEFNIFLRDLADRTKRETPYNPTKFRAMIAEIGGVATAKTLINKSQVSYGYTSLWRRCRLDLTLEASLWENPKFHSLFNEQEVMICQKRLKQYKYKSKKEK